MPDNTEVITIELPMGQRTLVAMSFEEFYGAMVNWTQEVKGFLLLPDEEGSLQMHFPAQFQRVLQGDQRTELDCLRDRRQLDGGLLAGSVPNSTGSSTPSTGSMEPRS
jgi:hypothetical protein